MSPQNYKSERLNQNEARKLIAELILDESCLVLTSHAKERMEERQLIFADIVNVLKSPAMRIIGVAEFSNFSWRYRCETNRLRVVISFSVDGASIVVVTVIRRQ